LEECDVYGGLKICVKFGLFQDGFRVIISREDVGVKLGEKLDVKLGEKLKPLKVDE